MKKGLIGKRAGLIERMLSRFPLTYNGILKNSVGSHFNTILDVGCGTGVPMELINNKGQYKATGVDIYSPYLNECKRKKIYNKLIKCDVRLLPFPNKSFDIVVCFHVIEHMSKKEGKEVLKNLEEIATKKVVLALPIGRLHQEAYDGNEHQEHKSVWYPEDMKKLGYKVVGQGLKAIYKEENVVEKYGYFAYAIFFMSILFQPFLFLKPEYAVYMICIKDMSNIQK